MRIDRLKTPFSILQVLDEQGRWLSPGVGIPSSDGRSDESQAALRSKLRVRALIIT